MTAETQTKPAIKYGPRRMGHCNLFVTDLERSMQFFNKVCGFEDVFRESALDFGFLSNGNTHHDIGLCEISTDARVGRDGHVQISEERGNHAGLNHFGWEMENEKKLVEAYNRAVAARHKIHRTTDHQISHSNYLFDPDGNLHEFYADAMTDWRTIFHGGSGPEISGNWDPNGAPPSTEPNYHDPFELRRVEEALIHPVRITHAVMMARNFEDMATFFTDIGGLSTVYGSSEGNLVCLAGTHSGYAYDIALVRQDPGKPAGAHHYSFEVADEAEITAAESAMQEAGIEIEFRVDDSFKRSFFIKDHDGQRYEFYASRSSEFHLPADADLKSLPFLV